MITKLQELNCTSAFGLYSNQKGKDQLHALRVGTIFVSTNIAETSLTFPCLRYVIDGGKVQRPRMLPAGMEGSVMETVDASIATLKQRVGRCGRTCDGDYLALYPKASLPHRKEHIDAKMLLDSHADLHFSLQLQLKEACVLTFPCAPEVPIRLPKLPDQFFSYPVLGGFKMAEAFYAAQQMKCGDDIFLLASLRMKIPLKTLQDLAFKSQNFVGSQPGLAGPPRGDITNILTVLRHLAAQMKMLHRPATEKDVCSWCNQHNLTDFGRHLNLAFTNYASICEYYVPKRPTSSTPHNAHPMFHRCPLKISFDEGGKKWNGFLHGRKNADGSPDMKMVENHEFRSLESGYLQPQNVIKALACGFKSNYFVHCHDLDGPIHHYARATELGDGGDANPPANTPNLDIKAYNVRTMSTFHNHSVLAKGKDKPVLVFSLDFILFGPQLSLDF